MDVEVRHCEFSLGTLQRADGSAVCVLGDSEAMIAVYGPGAVKSKNEKGDGATIKVAFQTHSSPPTLEENALALRLERILEEIILGALYPRSSISIAIQPLRKGADFFDAAFNGAIAALIDAAIPMTSVPISIQLKQPFMETIFAHTSKEIKPMFYSFENGDGLSLDQISRLLDEAQRQSTAIHSILQQTIYRIYNPQPA